MPGNIQGRVLNLSNNFYNTDMRAVVIFFITAV